MTQNRMSREMCYCAIKMGENELYHHGVPGMSWGDRNGPPYPLSGRAKKIARAEAKKKIEHEKLLEKRRKEAAKKRKQAAKLQRKQDKIYEMKQKLIAKGDIEAISRKRHLFTNEEIQEALIRNKQLVEAKYTKGVRKASDPHALEKTMNIVDKVGKIATAALPLVTIAKGMSELKSMNLRREYAENEERSKAIESKIRITKEFDPDAAAALASNYVGRTVTPAKEYKNSDVEKRISTIQNLYKMENERMSRYTKGSKEYNEAEQWSNYYRSELGNLVSKGLLKETAGSSGGGGGGGGKKK